MAVELLQSPALTVRPASVDDVQACGTICFEAFCAISDRHNYPHDFPSSDVTVDLIGYLIAHPGIYGVVAERDGKVIGSNFMDERSAIAGIGPITVDPTTQDRGVGRQLMEAVLDRADAQGFVGVRLVQAAYHTRSLSLYTKLGFAVREPLACMQGDPIGVVIPGRTVRSAREADLAACNRVCQSVHGHNRSGDLQEAIQAGTATVVEHDGRITGYATSIAFFGHAVGETDDDIKALIGAAPSFGGPGILVPARSPLFGWCLEQNLRTTQVMTLMSRGLYSEPAGSFLPSILY